MSVKSTANWTYLFLANTGRELAVPPLVFPGISTDVSQHYSYCVWVRIMAPRIPTPLIMHHGANGSFIAVDTDGYQWQIRGRKETVGLPTQAFGGVLYGRWTLICVSKSGPKSTIYIGEEDSFELSNPWEEQVDLRLAMEIDYDIDDPLGYIAVILSSGADVCNFKFWNASLTMAEFQTQAHTWSPAGSPAPIWASPLRTAGDINNVANPSSTVNWTAEHGWTSIQDSINNIITAGSLGAWNDPAYLAFNQPCPTWVYPVNFPTELGYVHINPGMTPVTTTIYKAPQFFQFADKGSIPNVDSSIQSIVHYATVYTSPADGAIPDGSFGLYKNEVGTEISPVFSDPANKFEQDSGVAIPGGIKATTMYSWKFGGQFRWQPQAPQVATATGALIHQFLYVTYIGFPTGTLTLSDVDLSGLFILSTKPPRADTYHNGTSLKIPDPTIRTALIGE
jgi:hypothetical protein